jgi:hypothetical protein
MMCSERTSGYWDRQQQLLLLLCLFVNANAAVALLERSIAFLGCAGMISCVATARLCR